MKAQSLAVSLFPKVSRSEGRRDQIQHIIQMSVLIKQLPERFMHALVLECYGAFLDIARSAKGGVLIPIALPFPLSRS